MSGPGAPRRFRDARHPYSPTRTVGPLVFVAGQLGVQDGDLVPGGVEAETRQAFANLEAQLGRHGLGLRHLVKVTVYLVSMTDRAAMDEVYVGRLSDPLPVRTCVAVAELPFGARVELDAVAAVEDA